MYVARIPNRKSKPTWLIRESKWVNGKSVKTTIANITKLPLPIILQIKELFKGGIVVKSIEDAFTLISSKPHGHVAIVLHMIKKLGIPKLLAHRDSRNRRLVLGMIAARVLHPSSKLATSTLLDRCSASSTLNEELALKQVDSDDLYQAIDWLIERKTDMEYRLSKRHLTEGGMVLYDLTSSYVEGKQNELAAFGYNRDRKRGKKQIVIGLMTDQEGCPVSVQIYKGNTSDPRTLSDQVTKLRETFGLQHVVMVGDRGILTHKGIQQELVPVGMDWISALRKETIASVVKQTKTVDLDKLDKQSLMEVQTDLFPQDRLIFCKNSVQKAMKQKRREEFLVKTEKALEQIVIATKRKTKPLKCETAIAIKVDRVVEKHKMKKYFHLEVKEGHLAYGRDKSAIERSAELDGVYAIRTSLKEVPPSNESIVLDYKGLSAVKSAFRSMKNISLKIRPIHHRRKKRVQAHVFLCMLAYYVEYHLRKELAPILFSEDDLEGKQAQRKDVVASASSSDQTKTKVRRKRNKDGDKVMSFGSLMNELTGVIRIIGKPNINTDSTPEVVILHGLEGTRKRAFDLLGIKIQASSPKG